MTCFKHKTQWYIYIYLTIYIYIYIYLMHRIYMKWRLTDHNWVSSESYKCMKRTTTCVSRQVTHQNETFFPRNKFKTNFFQTKLFCSNQLTFTAVTSRRLHIWPWGAAPILNLPRRMPLGVVTIFWVLTPLSLDTCRGSQSVDKSHKRFGPE